jgi:hypothetical protein
MSDDELRRELSGELDVRVYARAVRREDRLTGEALRQLDGALQWAEMGRIGAATAPATREVGESGPVEMAPGSPKLDASPDSSAG